LLDLPIRHFRPCRVALEGSLRESKSQEERYQLWLVQTIRIYTYRFGARRCRRLPCGAMGRIRALHGAANPGATRKAGSDPASRA